MEKELLIYISNDKVALTELTEEGISSKDFAKPGVWEEWSDYMTIDEAMEEIRSFLEGNKK